ncbi:beta-N-acetylhexosaminidase [Mangrovimonas sp. YM274]|uniref:beta-N-acetylhexosaminidase n=1 Tax=Mangrovimonas sp. YM274 TaxID=3070660 RepID=UPI0027DCE820|nr:family 20 glycosylhydrolase [Mangrovimonas sp. YM274]WMI68611.1 family 20 glycosylhydrolase [Mangrovimonas sp. YM274]
METYNLMPWPSEIREHNTRLVVDSELTISINGNSKGRVYTTATKFLRRLSGRTGVFLDQGFPVEDAQGTIQIAFDEVSNLTIETDESYSLEIKENNVLIKAKTDVGAMRALETLLQTVASNETQYYFPGLSINDQPRFVWRGLMIDVARHFQPVDVLKRNLDAMASVKMNVFHWHLIDDQGFRIESKVFPELTELASDGLFYTQEQIKDVVAYADKLGIRVVPEFDVPGHASAILTAFPELGSKPGYVYEVERYSGVFDPTLDPTNDKTYMFLERLFTEMTPLFPDAYFHIGGDENEGKHWDENEQIQKFKQKHKLKTNHDLQTYFNIKLEVILNKLGKKLMGWDEIMTENMPTTAVIHSWRGENEGFSKGETMIAAAKSGYNTVLSDGFYIDRMQSVVEHYSVEPIGDAKLTTEERKRILGGEVTMWSELVTPLTIDSRIWPRTAAIAERFWSPKEVNDVDLMLPRLDEVSFRLEELGITHLKNRDVILRMMTNNQNIQPLVEMSNICEPLEIYTRNENGTEYKTYSPFTLFADACVADAVDKFAIKKSVQNFVANPSDKSKQSVLEWLHVWEVNHQEMEKIQNLPNVQPLLPLSESLSETASLLAKILNDKQVSQKQLGELKALIQALKAPYVDVELVIAEDLEELVLFAEQNYLRK